MHMHCSLIMKFLSHRSSLTCLNGCVTSTQTLASQAGVDILKKGGNAADAAVAVAAVLNVLEPCSTGIGGDAFCLFYHKKTNTVKGLNASGKSTESLTLKHVQKYGYNAENKFPPAHVFSVTVPGACAGWVDCVEKFGSGSLSLSDIFKPAIDMARDGFPVSGPITSYLWDKHSAVLLDEQNKHGKELLSFGTLIYTKSEQYRAPQNGEIFKNLGLANVLEAVAESGKSGFYKGWIADAIVKVISEHGGVMNHTDLAEHSSVFVDPICTEYKGLKLWEIPPNGQGIVALEALNILKNFDLTGLEHNSDEYLHILIEALRLSFADALQYCADVSQTAVPVYELLDEKYARERARLINKKSALDICIPGDPEDGKGDTVYFTTADKDGNACSFINSNYIGFGTGLVPEGCGFTLHNRGYNFSLEEGHRNVLGPRKRPYHTIIPAMVTDAFTSELVMSYGVMGGFMQPQGHVQVLLNMLEFGMNPQEALDAPRFIVGSGHLSPLGQIYLEEGISDDVSTALKSLGHNVTGGVSGFDRAMFGRGQIIARKKFWMKGTTNSPVYWVGSDPRGDGVALGY